jgi:hypothetical protein
LRLAGDGGQQLQCDRPSRECPWRGPACLTARETSPWTMVVHGAVRVNVSVMS